MGIESEKRMKNHMFYVSCNKLRLQGLRTTSFPGLFLLLKGKPRKPDWGRE